MNSKFFVLSNVWVYNWYLLKAHDLAHLLDTFNVCLRSLENFLGGSEVKTFAKNEANPIGEHGQTSKFLPDFIKKHVFIAFPAIKNG